MLGYFHVGSGFSRRTVDQFVAASIDLVAQGMLDP
jgi:hypothetical protein